MERDWEGDEMEWNDNEERNPERMAKNEARNERMSEDHFNL